MIVKPSDINVLIRILARNHPAAALGAACILFAVFLSVMALATPPWLSLILYVCLASFVILALITIAATIFRIFWPNPKGK